VICETCNNDLRTFSTFRKDLVFKQLSLLQFVEGVDEEDDQQQQQQQEITYATETITNEFMEVKTETFEEEQQTLTDDYTNFVSAEYLEGFTEEAVIECVEHESGEFYAAETVASGSARKVQSRTKKFYKRALCGLCGKNYYKDQLQRHIDVSFFGFVFLIEFFN
jgi:hypothetical protein